MAATIDFYDTLGVSRTSEDVVIRAAYLALMRRYHPDGNPSSEAAERVRSITTAYAVLGDPAKRREYDRGSDFDGRPDQPEVHTRARGPLLFAATMLCMSVLILLIWAGKPTGEAGTADTAASAKVSDGSGQPRELDCLSETTKALVVPELVRRAANLSRIAVGDLAKLSGAMSVRTSPALSMSQPRFGFVECAAWVTVQGRSEQTANGAAPLLGNVEFTIGAGPGGEISLVEFNPDDRFLIDLASLGRANGTREASSETQPAPALQPAAPDRPSPVPQSGSVAVVADRHPRVERRPVRIVVGNPVVDRPHQRIALDKGALSARAPCRNERRRGSSCDDENLNLLDQQLAVFENQSLANANVKKREALRQTGARFEVDRKKCESVPCKRKLLLSRSREIADIMRTGSAAPR